jgi:hypothetical protein
MKGRPLTLLNDKINHFKYYTLRSKKYHIDMHILSLTTFAIEHLKFGYLTESPMYTHLLFFNNRNIT